MGRTPTPITVNPEQRLVIGNYPEGIVYADHFVEEHGDYKRLAFLSYRTLTLELSPHVPDFLRERIKRTPPPSRPVPGSSTKFQAPVSPSSSAGDCRRTSTRSHDAESLRCNYAGRPGAHLAQFVSESVSAIILSTIRSRHAHRPRASH